MYRLTDLSAATWLAEDTSNWDRLVSLGPSGYEAYARLRFIPDPLRPEMSANDLDLPDDHPSDLAQSRIVLAALDKPETACIFAVWEGWPPPYLDAALLTGPMFELPHRRYVLFAGELADLEGWEARSGGFDAPPPAFVWPAHRRWCFTCDVDPHWAGISGPAALIDPLIARADLDIVPASLDVKPPQYTH